MSRYDIADYLALSAETVSRTLTELRHRGAITFSGTHRLRIVDRSAFEEGNDAVASFWPARTQTSPPFPRRKHSLAPIAQGGARPSVRASEGSVFAKQGSPGRADAD
jgi:hypothetical protein